MPKNGDSAFHIARSIFSSDIWEDDPHLLKLWIYLIGNAVFTKNSPLYGTLDVSYRQIQEDNKYIPEKGTVKRKWSLEKIKNMLKKLEDQGRIICNRTRQGTHIKIVKYSDYQELKEYKRARIRTPETTTEHPRVRIPETLDNSMLEPPKKSIVRTSEQSEIDINTGTTTDTTEHKPNKNRTPTSSKSATDEGSITPKHGKQEYIYINNMYQKQVSDTTLSLSSKEKEKTEKSKKKKIKSEHSKQVREIFEYWQKTLGHPKAKLTNDRRTKILARLKEGYTVEQCKRAIDGCKASPFHMGDNPQGPFHMGDNPQGKIYDSITLIFRSGDKLEQFISYLDKKPRYYDTLKEIS